MNPRYGYMSKHGSEFLVNKPRSKKNTQTVGWLFLIPNQTAIHLVLTTAIFHTRPSNPGQKPSNMDFSVKMF